MMRYMLSQTIPHLFKNRSTVPGVLIAETVPADTRDIRDLSISCARHGDLRDPGTTRQ